MGGARDTRVTDSVPWNGMTKKEGRQWDNITLGYAINTKRAKKGLLHLLKHWVGVGT